MVKEKRRLNVDLLRVVAMLMVVVLHFLGKGGVLDAVPRLSFEYFVAWLFEGVALVAVNCYILISGYFLIKSGFKIKSLLALCAQVVFYSFFIFLLLVVTGKAQFDVASLFSSLFPVLTNEYWFITAYVGMYILSPFLNIFIKKLEKRQHQIFLGVLVLLFSVWPTLLSYFWSRHSFGDGGYGLSGGYSIIWFFILYVTAAYIRLYYKPDYTLTKHILRYIAAAIITPLCIYITGYLSVVFKDNRFIDLSATFLTYNFFPTYIASIAIFILFINITINSAVMNKAIAFLAPLALSVYLIHENPHVRAILWEKLQVAAHLPSHYFVLFAVGSILIIYLGCSMIDWLRLQLFSAIGRSIWFKSLYQAAQVLGVKIKGSVQKRLARYDL